MGLLPTESRAAAAPQVVALLTFLQFDPRAAQEAGTVRSRILHFFMFLASLCITDYVLVTVKQETANWLLALYAYRLLRGDNLVSKPIQANTVDHYLRDVAKFLKRFRTHDPRQLVGDDTSCDQLKKLSSLA